MSKSSMNNLEEASLSQKRIESKLVLEIRIRHQEIEQTSISMVYGSGVKWDGNYYLLLLSTFKLKNGGYGMKLSLPLEFNLRDNDLV